MKALLLILCLAANKTPPIAFSGFKCFGSIMSYPRKRKLPHSMTVSSATLSSVNIMITLEKWLPRRSIIEKPSSSVVSAPVKSDQVYQWMNALMCSPEASDIWSNPKSTEFTRYKVNPTEHIIAATN